MIYRYLHYIHKVFMFSVQFSQQLKQVTLTQYFILNPLPDDTILA